MTYTQRANQALAEAAEAQTKDRTYYLLARAAIQALLAIAVAIESLEVER